MGRLSRRIFAVGLSLIAGSAFARSRSRRCDVCDGQFSGPSFVYAEKMCCSAECADQLHPICAVCGAVIRGKYIQSSGANYCDNACYETTLNKCKGCGRPIRKGFVIADHTYCAVCVEESPVCFSCGLPAVHSVKIADGREICTYCMRWSVKEQGVALKNYEIARRNLEAWTQLKISSVPKLELVDREEMQELSKELRKSDSSVSIRGLYSRQVTITTHRLWGGRKEESRTERETIYIVNHLHDEVFRTAAVHELMHDLIHEHFQTLEDTPLWVQEGICQRAAAEYVARRGYADVLYGIETCEDPDYGDGYRYVKKVTGYDGWPALKRWLETVDVSALKKLSVPPLAGLVQE